MRNGHPPSLRGILGSLHLKLTIETDYVHDPSHLELQVLPRPRDVSDLQVLGMMVGIEGSVWG